MEIKGVGEGVGVLVGFGVEVGVGIGVEVGPGAVQQDVCEGLVLQACWNSGREQ